jgi:PleD family two-component response regulator
MNAHPERRRAVSQSGGPPLRLLVIDDDENYRAYLLVLGQRLGFAVDDAVDGEAGLAKLSAGGYDVAIIDHEMPRVNGIDVIRALRGEAATQATYALMLTAHDDMTTKLAALEAGFDDFVSKSSSEKEIVAKIVASRRIAARQRTLDVAIRELYGLATRDDLTGVFNRRFFAETEAIVATRS